MSKVVRIHEFNPEEMPKSATMFVVAPPGAGKTTFIMDLIYRLKHNYPAGRVFAGTQDAHDTLSDTMGGIYVTKGLDTEQLTKHVERQKAMTKLNGEHHPSNYAVCILDDVCDDPKIFRTPLFKDIFKNGSQHYDQLFVVALQYAVDVPPDLRKSVSYVALFREPNEIELKKLYGNFGGICGSYDDFKSLMSQLTGDFTCMIIKMRSQSNNLEDNVFWYQAKKDLPDWRFGSSESITWNKMRVKENNGKDV